MHTILIHQRDSSISKTKNNNDHKSEPEEKVKGKKRSNPKKKQNRIYKHLEPMKRRK